MKHPNPRNLFWVTAALFAPAGCGGTTSDQTQSNVGGQTLAPATGGTAAAGGEQTGLGGDSPQGGSADGGGSTQSGGNGGSATTGGMPVTGGMSSVGGDEAAGGKSNPSGSGGSGGAVTAGGNSSNGGSSSGGGSAGTGCTGYVVVGVEQTWVSIEATQASTGLCVAKLVTVGTASGPKFGIDATEVTFGQYSAWLAINPALPSSADADCGWKATGTYAPDPRCVQQYPGNPINCVDWCDAYYYCQTVGKRLCGKIGGGPNAFGDYASASLSQWYNACTSGGVNQYSDGGNANCNGQDYWTQLHSGTPQVSGVGTFRGCTSSVAGYTGVYDLSGNVWEWEDSCDGNGQSSSCRHRGGAFNVAGAALRCDYNESMPRSSTGSGFRCCSP
jgi:formylglycine-generating enzyme